MNSQEILNDLIHKAELSTIKKHQLKSLVQYAYEERQEDKETRELVAQVAFETSSLDIVFRTDNIIIYKVNKHDDWGIKYPFRSIILKGDRWHSTNMFSHDIDSAFLIALGIRQLGHNSQFYDFAAKMLELKRPE